jgi:predicted nucleic-acid-binding protein
MTLRANDLISLDTNVLVHWIRQNDTILALLFAKQDMQD